ncbi:MAG TPA: hypothetical protein VNQ80_12270 [Parapedobacter sp.]|uniref:hypothetical protein n=1 Tax=Parapedobacter sp. TaxID=1958893 RepID=UPI002CC2DCAE|nr:hypothetical protein [Parapedobacter sp.]HWK58112.1 hypothetical protein [Parapedobacter sp.]
MSDVTLHQNFGLDEEQLEKLEKLAALGYEPADIARYFNLPVKPFEHIANDPTSHINYRIEAGKFKALANESLTILSKAERGDIDASKRLQDIRKNRGFKISKTDIFGTTDRKSLQALEDWIQGGSKSNLHTDEKIYLDALTLINSMDRKYGRRNTVDFFVKTYGLKHARASEMYDESVNLFYSDRNVEKKALRIKKAEFLEDLARAAFDNAESAKDIEVAANIEMKAAKLRGLDQPDPEKLPAEAFRKPVRVFSLDAPDIGLPAPNRNVIAKQIDALEIPESDKARIRKDARLEPIILDQYLDELETESKEK